jgi:uncharacterized repeat protein (TIGR01451 family)
MTHIFKTVSLSKLNKISDLGWQSLLASIAFFGFFALPSTVYAQSAACAANESALTYSFAAPNAWPAGAGTNTVNLGAGANALTIVGNATLNSTQTGNPVTREPGGGVAASGGFPSVFYYLVNLPDTTTTNALTLTFSKPISKLQLVATDIDFNTDANGSYDDRVTVTGAGPSGPVTPTAAAQNTALVTATGNVAQAIGTAAQNCADTSNGCNATYTFAQPVTSVVFSYTNGPRANGNPPGQVVGLAALGFCVQNPDLSLVKDDAGASFTAGSTGTYSFAVSNVGSAATSGTTTVKDILPAGMSFGTPLTPGGANAAAWTCVRSTTTNTDDTATCTSTTSIAAAGSSTFTLPVSVASTVTSGTTLTNRAKVFGGGDPNKAAETTTGAITACASDSLAGAVANAGCGFETTPIVAAASVVISKTDSKAVTTAAGTNAYVVTLTNQGPSSANGVIVTDVVGAGLTCPPANAVTCTVTGVGAVCPAGPLTIASLTAGVAVATLPSSGALQFAYTCNVN